jgi:nucleoside 2-deoxyribosyltransferase
MGKTEVIYIAGPECFFENGNEILSYMRILSESYGHIVSLPNDDPLKMDHQDLRLNAHEIFQNLKQKMNETTLLICDLDPFRGAEPDSGSIYEIGMAYARNLKIFGYTKDKRTLVWKDQKLTGNDAVVLDENGKRHPYYFLPFSPLVMASTEIIEGNFDDVLSYYECSKYYEIPNLSEQKEEKIVPKSIFLALRDYYTKNNDLKGKDASERLKEAGYQVIYPYFTPYDHKRPLREWIAELLQENLKRVDQCEYFAGDLNDFRGYECSNDVAFLSGYAFQKGKKLFGFMDDVRPMIEKIPNRFVCGKYKDLADRDVENWFYNI